MITWWKAKKNDRILKKTKIESSPLDLSAYHVKIFTVEKALLSYGRCSCSLQVQW